MPKGVYKRTKTIPYERFLQNIRILKNGCWKWTACTMACGYGQFWDGEKHVLAHRWSYQFHIGKIPSGKEMDHLCRNRPCVNPYHLEPVTSRENTIRGNAGHHRREEAKLITKCPKGHPYSKENTFIRKTKYGVCRICRECARQKCSDWYNRVKDERRQYFRDYNNAAYRRKTQRVRKVDRERGKTCSQRKG